MKIATLTGGVAGKLPVLKTVEGAAQISRDLPSLDTPARKPEETKVIITPSETAERKDDMSFLKKIGGAIKSVAQNVVKPVTGIVSKLNIPIISQAAGIAGMIIPEKKQVQQAINVASEIAQAAVFPSSSSTTSVGSGSMTNLATSAAFLPQKDQETIIDRVLGKGKPLPWYAWAGIIAVPVLIIGFFIFKRKRRR